MPDKTNVIYLRGLNSHGDDKLRFGLFTFGTMAGPWIRALASRPQINAMPLKGFGAGPLENQIRRASQILQSSEIWQSGEPLHLLGHSTGGLIARALPHHLPEPRRILTVTTMGTPNRGTPLASLIENLPKSRPALNAVFRAIRYDIGEKVESFLDLTPKAIAKFNSQYPDLASIRYCSAVFSLSAKQMTLPIRAIGKWVDPEGTMLKNDGIIERDSQLWGEVFCELSLDHLEQIGYTPRLNFWLRSRQRENFQYLVEAYLKCLG